MKKIQKTLTLLCMLTMVFTLTACGAREAAQTSAPSTEPSASQASAAQDSDPAGSALQPSEEESVNETENTEPEDTGARILVAYFSATGNTKALAEYAADAMGADLYEMIPEEPYTDAELDYGNTQSRSSLEMNDPNARPAIFGEVGNMEQYDIIFLGYPKMEYGFGCVFCI